MPFISPRPTLVPGQSAPTIRADARWAYIIGMDVSDNPHRPGSPAALEWMAAWFHEKQEHEESIVALCHQRGRLGL